MLIEITKITEGVKKPEYKKDLDVGADLYLPKDFKLLPNVMNKVPLGIAINIPQGFEGQVRPRSGTLLRGITIHNPPIDPGYTGEIHAMVSILGDEPIEVFRNERICSLLITPVTRAQFVGAINRTERGDKGFNSSGL